MGLPGTFSKELHRSTDYYAAWMPVSNPFAIGDIAKVSDGVFVKVGHVSDIEGFDVGLDIAPAASLPSVDFSSEGTRVVKFLGDAEVDALPDSDIEAKLAFEFTRENSALVKAADVSTESLQNLSQVADRLAELKNRMWRWSNRVVFSTLAGQNMTIVASSEAGTKFELSGTAAALKQLQLGNATAGIEFSSSSARAFEAVNASGIFGLRCFKLGFLGGGLDVLASGEDPDSQYEVEDDFGDDLEDTV